MDILGCLSHLIYQNDCVIVPGFGAFISKKIPSQLRENSSEIFPPSKKILFNASLKQSDGLLIFELAKKENISYDRASKEIDFLVKKWDFSLKNEKKLFLKNLGDFELNQENKLIFSPSLDLNYLKSSFGLTAIKAKKISSSSKASSWRYAAAVFFLCFLGIKNLDKNKLVSSDSLGSFFSPRINSASSRETPDKERNVDLSKNKKLDNPHLLEKKEFREAFFIIAGVFHSSQKASVWASKLKKDFELTEVFIENEKTYVSLLNCQSYFLAKEKIEHMRKKHKFQDPIWIKKRQLEI